MTNCPNCQEPELTWVKTPKGKWWLKKSLGDGQVSKNWHDCNDTQTDLSQSQNITPTKRGWIERMCKCGVKIFYPRKRYNERTSDICEECLVK